MQRSLPDLLLESFREIRGALMLLLGGGLMEEMVLTDHLVIGPGRQSGMVLQLVFIRLLRVKLSMHVPADKGI